ncbi:MAG TPA: protein phosphatase 2C domain-containing protein [Solirubrobacteraceae bacterium]|nr:protein phosphatase 2C domain-containing protein [Solirubrobacteraceae bacterium]
MPALILQPAVLSEVGLRGNNEDAAFASPRLVAVADGVGGAAAGERASRAAIMKLASLDKRRLVNALETELADAIADANDLISFGTFAEPRHAGMATTLTAVAMANDGRYLIANVGDSRTYLFRGGRLSQLTRDDSLVQELIDQGDITEGEARAHPQRSVVLSVLDGGKQKLLVLRAVDAQAGDRLLLCSDGVSDYLADEEIAALLELDDADDAVRQIVDAALASGSRDNVTAVIADVTARQDPEQGWLDALPADGSLAG